MPTCSDPAVYPSNARHPDRYRLLTGPRPGRRSLEAGRVGICGVAPPPGLLPTIPAGGTLAAGTWSHTVRSQPLLSLPTFFRHPRTVRFSRQHLESPSSPRTGWGITRPSGMRNTSYPPSPPVPFLHTLQPPPRNHAHYSPHHPTDRNRSDPVHQTQQAPQANAVHAPELDAATHIIRCLSEARWFILKLPIPS